MVTKETNGNLHSALYDRRSGTQTAYGVHQFARGDVINFRLNPALATGAAVRHGDTLGVLQSNRLQYELTQLQGDIDKAIASLSVRRAGKKEAVIQEAKQRLLFAQTQTEQQAKTFARVQSLFERGVATVEEVELAENTLALNRIKVDIAAAELHSAQTGGHQAELDLVHRRIANLKEAAAVLDSRLDRFSLVSPLNGIVASVHAADTLLVVQDWSDFWVFMPVLWKDRPQIAVGQPVELRTFDHNSTYTATVERLDLTVQTIDYQQFFLAVARLNSVGEGLAPGLAAECSINCPPLPLKEYLSRLFD